MQVFFAEFLNMQVFLPFNLCISKYSYSIAEYFHIRVFFPIAEYFISKYS
jgi:hypothetical protein